MIGHNMSGVSRREMLKTSMIAAGAAVVGFEGLFGVRGANAAADDDVQTILNLAATAETLACTHYYTILTTSSTALTPNKVQFDKGQVAYLVAALDSEYQHLSLLNANGGKALVDKFFMPKNVFTDMNVFTAYSEIAENAFIGAYLAATRRFAELNNPLLAATAAQICAVEAQHLALVRQIAGKLPNNVSLVPAPYFHVSDVVATITSYLQGADGFDTTPTPYPGATAIQKLIANSGLVLIKPFTDVTQFQANGQATQEATKAVATPAATMTAAQ